MCALWEFGVKHINCISSPRNISTAMMYSFAQRQDTRVVDEPFYACYLSRTGKQHPGRDEILAEQPHNYEEVINNLERSDKPVLYIKNMAHHMRFVPTDLFDSYTTILLIRDPRQLIASFAKVINRPQMEDIGVRDQYDIWQYCLKAHDEIIILDSNEVLKDPAGVLTTLCDRIGLDFDATMLSWPPGGRPEDGCWARYWYANVHKSTGFAKQTTSSRPFPEDCMPLLEEAMPLYEQMFSHAIKA